MINFRALIGLILLLMLMTSTWFYFSYQRFFESTLNISNSIEFNVKPGEGVNQIVERLYKQKLIKSTWQPRLFIKLNENQSQIKVGHYLLTPDLNFVQLLEKFNSGEQIQYQFTVVEGLRFWDIVELIKQNKYLNLDKINNLSREDLLESLQLKFAHQEGSLFADTYKFPKGYDAIELLRRSHQQLLSVLNEEWENKLPELPYQTPYEALIMASIIEKETALSSERPLIAGVFVRRIQKKMRLQTDPTVIYGIGENFDGNIRRKDLRTDTPYNTYTRHGLPPTPIAIVGREAINAALNPTEGTALYFVARGDGSHQFSDTLSEHNKAVRRYQLKK
ncbi:MAG: endolytic transglycosylase MltG [Gammaproteobacteria bacterium]|nr:endolytic transglycosylase MltG [Gammaproteobacteria bacterium]